MLNESDKPNDSTGNSNNNMPSDMNFIPKNISEIPKLDEESLKHITNEKARKFFVEKLGAPRLVLAPMVDASELAWRELARRRGANLCYTPMLHSGVFNRDPKYRQEGLQSCSTDRPLIIQVRMLFMIDYFTCQIYF